MENKKIICTVKDLEDRGISAQALQLLKRDTIHCKVGNNDNTYQIYLDDTQVFEGDFTETEKILERMEEAALFPDRCIGEAIQNILEHNGITQLQLENVLLISGEEIRLLESNKVVPSEETITFLGNMFSVYPSSLKNNELISMRNKDELQQAINDLATESDKIEQSTSFYKEHMDKWGIKQGDTKEKYFIGKETEIDEEYIVLDTQNETCILSDEGTPQIFTSREAAESVAATLNQQKVTNQSEKSDFKKEKWFTVKDEDKEIKILADRSNFTTEEGIKLLEQHKHIERELKAPKL